MPNNDQNSSGRLRMSMGNGGQQSSQQQSAPQQTPAYPQQQAPVYPQQPVQPPTYPQQQAPQPTQFTDPFAAASGAPTYSDPTRGAVPPVPPETPPVYNPPTPDLPPVKVKKKAGKGLKVAGIAGVAAVVLIGGPLIAYGVSDTVKNQVKVRFSSPENYFEWVCEKNAEDYGKASSEAYEAYIERIKSGATQDVNVRYTFSDETRNLLLEDAGLDQEVQNIVQNLKDVSVNVTVESKKHDLIVSGSANVNGNHVISADAALRTDENDMRMFLRSTDLTPQWLTMNMGEYIKDELDYDHLYYMDEYERIGYTLGYNGAKKFMDDPEDIIKPDELQDMIERYTTAIASAVTDPEVETGAAVDVGDLTVSYSAVTFQLGEKEVLNAAIKVLSEAKNDSVLRSILTSRIDDVLSKDKYNSMIESALEELKDDRTNKRYSDEDVAEVTVFVAGTGTIAGFEIKSLSEYDNFRIYAAAGKDGKQIGGTFHMDIDSSETIDVRLNGEKSGKAYSGDVVASYTDRYDNGKLTLQFNDFEIVDEEKCYMKGDFTLQIDGVSDTIKLTLDSDKSSQEISYHMLIGGKDYGTITVDYAVDKGMNDSMPRTEDAYSFDPEYGDIEDLLNTYVTKEQVQSAAETVLKGIGMSDSDASRMASELADDMFYSYNYYY